MKNLYLILGLFIIVGATSCKSDNASTEEMTEEVKEEAAEELAEDFVAKQLAEAEAAALAAMDENTGVKNEVEVKLEEVDVDKEAVIEQKKEILKEQLKESPNLGKDCESILKDYEKLVTQYVNGENEEGVLAQLAKWANDPVFNNCKKNAEYKDRFFELEEKMYADEDEEL